MVFVVKYGKFAMCKLKVRNFKLYVTLVMLTWVSPIYRITLDHHIIGTQSHSQILLIEQRASGAETPSCEHVTIYSVHQFYLCVCTCYFPPVSLLASLSPGPICVTIVIEQSPSLCVNLLFPVCVCVCVCDCGFSIGKNTQVGDVFILSTQ